MEMRSPFWYQGTNEQSLYGECCRRWLSGVVTGSEPPANSEPSSARFVFQPWLSSTCSSLISQYHLFTPIMNRTAWTNQKSHLTSDRLKPKPQPNNVASPKTKGKSKQQQSPSPSKSKEVRRIETLLNGIRKATGQEKDPKGGCFCLGKSDRGIHRVLLNTHLISHYAARTHELSPYSPICNSCGLILCSLNLPQYRCASCDTVLMTEPVRASLINQLESELASVIAKEEEAREKAIEEAQKSVGAFPTLSATTQPISTPSPIPAAATQPQTHKVLSLTSKKRAIVTSYTTTPAQSRPVSRNESIEEEQPVYVPKPSQEPPYSKERPKPDRPWENLMNRGVMYRPRKRLDDGATSSTPSSRKKRGNKAKDKENEVRTEWQSLLYAVAIGLYMLITELLSPIDFSTIFSSRLSISNTYSVRILLYPPNITLEVVLSKWYRSFICRTCKTSPHNVCQFAASVELRLYRWTDSEFLWTNMKRWVQVFSHLCRALISESIWGVETWSNGH